MATYKRLLTTKAGDTIIPVTERDVYSTTEQVVGEWIDGKTIYRRVFTGTIANEANVRNAVVLWQASPIAQLVGIGGWIRYGVNGINTAMFTAGTAEYRLVYVQTGSNNLSYAILSASASNNRPYEIWVEYTKNTD
jgi:hypothetical protein